MAVLMSNIKSIGFTLSSVVFFDFGCIRFKGEVVVEYFSEGENNDANVLVFELFIMSFWLM